MVIPAGVLVVTDRRLCRPPLIEVVAAAVAGGARWVLLRERDLPAAQRRETADELRALLRPVGGRLIVAGPDPLGGDAVHLAAADPYPCPAVTLVGRSCHDAAEVSRVSMEDYMTLSPVFSTRTKPGYGPALGPGPAARLAATARPGSGRPGSGRPGSRRPGSRRPGSGVGRGAVAWLALGGVDRAERSAACLAAGAAGVAAMGAVMRADDPAAVVRLLAEPWLVAA